MNIRMYACIATGFAISAILDRALIEAASWVQHAAQLGFIGTGAVWTVAAVAAVAALPHCFDYAAMLVED